MIINRFGQPVGDKVPVVTRGRKPEITFIPGDEVTVERIDEKHFDDLFPVFSDASADENFTYMAFERFKSNDDFRIYFDKMIVSEDPYYLVITDNNSGKALGIFSLMRTDEKNRVTEIGGIVYSTSLKKTRKATEAQYLLMRYVFDNLGYRRYEWKCDSLNKPSVNSALRLGFTYEGTFRQAMIYKGRNRDTSWFSITDREWPVIRQRFEKWLGKSNFDDYGNQVKSLRDF